MEPEIVEVVFLLIFMVALSGVALLILGWGGKVCYDSYEKIFHMIYPLANHKCNEIRSLQVKKAICNEYNYNERDSDSLYRLRTESTKVWYLYRKKRTFFTPDGLTGIRAWTKCNYALFEHILEKDPYEIEEWVKNNTKHLMLIPIHDLSISYLGGKTIIFFQSKEEAMRFKMRFCGNPD